MNSGKVVLGLLAGVAAGAILGILLAPEKGKVTRGKISKKGHDISDDLTEKLKGFSDMITDQIEAIKEEALHLAKDAKRTVETTAEEITSEAKKK